MAWGGGHSCQATLLGRVSRCGQQRPTPRPTPRQFLCEKRGARPRWPEDWHHVVERPRRHGGTRARSRQGKSPKYLRTSEQPPCSRPVALYLPLLASHTGWRLSPTQPPLSTFTPTLPDCSPSTTSSLHHPLCHIASCAALGLLTLSDERDIYQALLAWLVTWCR